MKFEIMVKTANMLSAIRNMLDIIESESLGDRDISSELQAILSGDNFSNLIQILVERGYKNADEMRRLFAFELSEKKPIDGFHLTECNEEFYKREGIDKNKKNSDKRGIDLSEEDERAIWKRRIAEFFPTGERG
jgi:hypothetical protein